MKGRRLFERRTGGRGWVDASGCFYARLRMERVESRPACCDDESYTRKNEGNK